MVVYTEHDLISVSEFPYAWRITDTRWNRLPAETLRRLLPFGPVRGAQLAAEGRILRHSGPPYVNPEEYHVVSDCSLWIIHVEDRARVSAWLAGLPIPSDEAVYASWRNGPALTTDWSTFIQACGAIVCPPEALDVFDASRQWGVLFGPEEFAVYVERGPVERPSLQFERAAGMSLVTDTRVSMLAACGQWFEARRPELERNGVSLKLAPPTQGSSLNSVRAEVTYLHYEWMALLWQNGMSDFHFVNWNDLDADVEVTHRTFAHESELFAALEAMLRRVGAQ